MNWNVLRRVGLYVSLVILYLVSTVPVGLFLYGIKTEVGFDIFEHGGLHAYMQCLSTSFPLKDLAITEVAPQRFRTRTLRKTPVGRCHQCTRVLSV